MAESMQGLKRTHRCAELSAANVGETVTIMGWVQKNRNKGGLVFTDVRDRSGIIQVVCEEGKTDAALIEKAASLRSEYVVAIVGEVAKRSGAVNEKIATGEIEVLPTELRILSESMTPPFQVEENSKTKEEVRLKYRYLDLRRPDLQKNFIMKSQVMTLTRQFFADEGFLEVETPMLGKTTPEGARDYLVPSRVHPGCFYGLPQSPQLYKQLLMCSGFDRYIQIARCFRDEDLRADRQPEFTQIDMELSFVDVDDVIDVNERYLAKLFKEVLDVDVQLPIQRMTWQEAMDRFGSDKPDLRFGMELTDVTDVVKGCGFGVFTGAIENGGSVRGINAKGQGSMPRKKIDKLTAFVKDYGAKGLAYIAIQEDGTVKSSFAKFMSEEEMDALIKAMDGQPGDLLLFAADKNKVVWDSLGALRVELAKQLDLLDKNEYRFVWITEFPQFEWSDEQGRYLAMHHPFTMPMEEDLPLLDKGDLGKIRAKAYDIVLNGNEIGGGSVRIHQNDIQEKMFEALGFTKEQAHSQFGFLLEAFKYGVPPHAGLAYGLDLLQPRGEGGAGELPHGAVALDVGGGGAVLIEGYLAALPVQQGQVHGGEGPGVVAAEAEGRIDGAEGRLRLHPRLKELFQQSGGVGRLPPGLLPAAHPVAQEEADEAAVGLKVGDGVAADALPLLGPPGAAHLAGARPPVGGHRGV